MPAILVTPKRHTNFVEMLRCHMYTKRVSREEMCASLAMGHSTYYNRLSNPDTLSVGELRLLIKATKASEDAAKRETINALIWGK